MTQSFHFRIVFLIHTLVCLVSLAQEEPEQPPVNHRLQCELRLPKRKVFNHPSSKILIAHRGASYHLPEHTLASYRLALELGADYIEPDLIATRDGHLVAHHSLDLNDTTNVAEIFPDRYSVRKNQTGYWVVNFDLEEIQQLSVRQRYSESRSTLFDGLFKIPTLQEILELIEDWNQRLLPMVESRPPDESEAEPSSRKQIATRRSGVYAELKDPKWYQEVMNVNLVDLFLKEISESKHTKEIFNDTRCESLPFDGYLVPPLVVQCFDAEVLEELYNKWPITFDENENDNNSTSGTTTAMKSKSVPPMVLLADAPSCLEEDFWFRIPSFLQGIGPSKKCLEPLTTAEAFQVKALEQSLAVHVWTERPEYDYVSEYFPSLREELMYLLCEVGVDGVFTEDVTTASLVIHQEDCQSRKVSTFEPTPSPTDGVTTSTATIVDAKNTSGIPQKESPLQCSGGGLSEESAYLGIAAGVMGLFIGILSTVSIMRSRLCKSKRHSQRQLQIPTNCIDDNEII